MEYHEFYEEEKKNKQKINQTIEKKRPLLERQKNNRRGIELVDEAISGATMEMKANMLFTSKTMLIDQSSFDCCHSNGTNHIFCVGLILMKTSWL